MASKSTTNRTKPIEAEAPDPPPFEIPRFWSNPHLKDPDTIIALVLERPTTVDLARTIATYGVDRVRRVRARTRSQRTSSQNQWLSTLWQPVLRGVRRAHRSAS